MSKTHTKSCNGTKNSYMKFSFCNFPTHSNQHHKIHERFLVHHHDCSLFFLHCSKKLHSLIFEGLLDFYFSVSLMHISTFMMSDLEKLISFHSH